MDPAAILTVMLERAPFFQDVGLSREERAVLYKPAAEAIAIASHTIEDAAFLIAQGEHETHFAKNVLEGHCELMPKGMQCDPDKHGVARARGPWQVWRAACRAEDLVGQARCVLGTAHMGRARCGGWSGGFGALTGKWACVERPDRLATMQSVLRRWGQP